MAETSVKDQICRHCDADVRPDTQFCYNCGGSLAAETTDGWQATPPMYAKPSNGVAAKPTTKLKTTENAPKTPASEPATNEEPPKLKSAASMRRRSKVFTPKRTEIIWEEHENAPNFWFILAAVLLTLGAVGLFYVASYLK